MVRQLTFLGRKAMILHTFTETTHSLVHQNPEAMPPQVLAKQLTFLDRTAMILRVCDSKDKAPQQACDALSKAGLRK